MESVNELQDQVVRIGIIYNWKGLKEENYIYTPLELAEYDPTLLTNCLTSPNEWHPSTLSDCAWKTWEGTLLESDDEIRSFLNGDYNSDYEDECADWYWANEADNDLYGHTSHTMVNEIKRLNISEEYLQ